MKPNNGRNRLDFKHPLIRVTGIFTNNYRYSHKISIYGRPTLRILCDNEVTVKLQQYVNGELNESIYVGSDIDHLLPDLGNRKIRLIVSGNNSNGIVEVV